MEKKHYEYFRSDVVFYGKHCKYIDAIWEQNKIQNSFIRTLYELYAISAVIGLRLKSPKPIDKTEKSDDNLDLKRTILTSQLMGYSSELNTIMTLVLLLDETSMLTDKQRIDRAFRGPNNEDEFKSNIELFNAYVRGGIEYLYENLVLRPLTNDDFSNVKVANIVALLNNPLIPEISI